jgi:predicted enzyme related to lactoylglutathione lyase
MHKSRLCAFVIDCEVDDLDAAAQFWSRALGRELQPPAPDSPTYRGIEARAEEPMLLLQQVEHPSRVHLDIESDDVEAEVARLEALGARRIAKVQTWWVMEAPSGHRFCVVRLQRGPLGDDANQWP